MNKAQMSLEYVMKITILLVVVVVVIGLILKFRSEILVWLKEIFGGDEVGVDFPQIIEKNSFSAGEISTYIESCHFHMVSLPEDEQKDIVCYLLQSKNGFIGIEQTAVRPPDIEISFDQGWNGGEIIKIKYEDIGNKIIVSD